MALDIKFVKFSYLFQLDKKKKVKQKCNSSGKIYSY